MFDMKNPNKEELMDIIKSVIDRQGIDAPIDPPGVSDKVVDLKLTYAEWSTIGFLCAQGSVMMALSGKMSPVFRNAALAVTLKIMNARSLTVAMENGAN